MATPHPAASTTNTTGGRILDGKGLADRWKKELSAKVTEFVRSKQVTPGLHVVLVGDNPASVSYVTGKKKACEAVGMSGTLHLLPADTPTADIIRLIEKLNQDRSVHGILVQLPLPSGQDEREVIAAIDPRKDVDGLHVDNLGRLTEGTPRFVPCTPAGVFRMLVDEGIDVAGKDVAIVGRSLLVGRPLALLLSNKGKGGDATVTMLHSRSSRLAEHCRSADILIVAIGKAKGIGANMVKPGAVVIDVGINRGADGKLVGDVDYHAIQPIASAITPVPGGVGPLTVAMLLENTLKAATLLAD